LEYLAALVSAPARAKAAARRALRSVCRHAKFGGPRQSNFFSRNNEIIDLMVFPTRVRALVGADVAAYKAGRPGALHAVRLKDQAHP
jgi:hypothetical protein